LFRKSERKSAGQGRKLAVQGAWKDRNRFRKNLDWIFRFKNLDFFRKSEKNLLDRAGNWPSREPGKIAIDSERIWIGFFGSKFGFVQEI